MEKGYGTKTEKEHAGPSIMNKSRHKRSKFGDLPGDLSKQVKINMLEGNTPIQVFPWQTINDKCAKSYRKDFQKKANRRFRHNANKEINENSGS